MLKGWDHFNDPLNKRNREKDLGKEELDAMSETEIEEALWDVVQEMCDDPTAVDPRYSNPSRNLSG